MLIAQGQLLFGVSAKLLQFAALAVGNEFNAIHVSYELGASVDEVEPILERLIAAGWLVRTPGQARQYAAEAPWRQLRAARTGRPLPREKADLLVAEMLARVKAANRSPRPDRGLITRVVLFGSYLNQDKDELGDVDLAFEYLFPENAPEFPNLFGKDGSASIERNAVKVIKNASMYLSLTYMWTVRSLGCEYREVYNVAEDMELWSPDAQTAAAYPKTRGMVLRGESLS